MSKCWTFGLHLQMGILWEPLCSHMAMMGRSFPWLRPLDRLELEMVPINPHIHICTSLWETRHMEVVFSHCLSIHIPHWVYEFAEQWPGPQMWSLCWVKCLVYFHICRNLVISVCCGSQHVNERQVLWDPSRSLMFPLFWELWKAPETSLNRRLHH